MLYKIQELIFNILDVFASVGYSKDSCTPEFLTLMSKFAIGEGRR
jgi:hypothetical protein